MFSEYAPHYWAKNLPAMPLRPQSKVPALNSWQAYGVSMPSLEEQEHWLRYYGDGNIGMPLGPQSGIVGLDLDSIDPRVMTILEELLPPTPWKRIGKKGFVAAFKYNGERTYRIKDSDGNTIMELLSKGAQIVLPPSIHPDTMLPYQANSNLYDVLDQLVPLPAQFEQNVRQELINAGFKLTSRGATKVTEWVPAGGRDSMMISMAGLFARSVLRGERTLIEAMAEMDAWVHNYTEKVVGDEMDTTKARAKVMEFVRRDVAEGGRKLPQGWDMGMPTDEVKQARTYFGEDIEEWPYEQIMDYLTQQFVVVPIADSIGRTKIIEEVLVRLARSKNLTALETERISNFIVGASGREMTVGALRKRIKELQGGELLGNDHTEIAKALLTELERFGEVRYQHSLFHQWTGSHWDVLSDNDLIRTLAENFGHLPAARKANDHKGIVRTLAALVDSSLKQINVPGVNFANGYLTTDMELLAHDPRFGARYTLPYRYAPAEAAPIRFLSFLDQVWGEDADYLDKLEALRETISVTLFQQATKFQRAFLLYGQPQSGKSQLMDIIKGLLPSTSVSAVSPHNFIDKFAPVGMNGKLLNFAGELSDTQLIEGNSFKEIIDGTERDGQFKGKDIFKFEPLCAQWFCSNHLPRTRDTSDGFNRRWLIFRFEKTVSDDEKVLDLGKDIVADEREAIVAWALGSFQTLMSRNNYTIPASHFELISEVASQNNNVRFFLTTGAAVHVTGNHEDVVAENVLYAQYYAFCRVQSNSTPFQQKRFRLTMQELGRNMGVKVHVDRADNREDAFYYGIKLKVGQGRKAA